MSPRAAFVAVAVVLGAVLPVGVAAGQPALRLSAVASGDGNCGAGTGYDDVVCPPSNSTCCKYAWSENVYGCCQMPNAVCCSNGYTCCPTGTTCKDSGSSWSVVTTCEPSQTSQPASATTQYGEQICKIGPQQPLSTTLPNVLILGDSVSIGYEPFVAQFMANVSLVQHTPWSGDGGSCETAYTLQCLDRFLSSPSGESLDDVDVLYFNSGLHNLLTSGMGVPGQSGNTSVYAPELRQIAERLVAWAKPRHTQLLFALTSPWLCNKTTNDIIVANNAAALSIMQSLDIPTVDLHTPLIDKCGQPPVTQCFGKSDCYCPHCPGCDGYPWLAQNVIVPAIAKLLPTSSPSVASLS